MDSFINNPGLRHIGTTIFKNLDHKSLLACRLVSRSWKGMVDDPKFWLKKCDEIGRQCLILSPYAKEHKHLPEDADVVDFTSVLEDLQENFGTLIQNLDRIQPLWSTSLKKELGTILKIRLQLFIT